MNQTTDPNEHIRNYLRYYLGLNQPPQYAVLLEAPWGAGKTFQTRKIVSEIVGPGNYVLVSLNGLATQKDIDDALVAAMYPWSATKGAKLGAAVGKAILKHAKIELPQVETSDLINHASNSVFVFDDLERCQLPIKESLGYINQFVERDGCKVIVLANESQIADQKAYRLGKEKLVGKTLHVHDDFDGAFSYFISGTEDASFSKFLMDSKEHIRTIYEQSGLSNLRILQQTIWDYSRLFTVLSEDHKSNKDAMRNLLQVFFALSFEVKSGRIENDDLLNRMGMAVSGIFDEQREKNPFADTSERYPGIALYDTILSDEIFHQILALGLIDQAAVRDALNASSWFVTANEPAWRTVWYSAERDDDEVRAAIAKMTKEFRQRHYDAPGEVLHVFGQMLWLASIGASGWSTEKTIAECRKYVDDLRASNRLPTIGEGLREHLRFGAYAGLGFHGADTPEFRELWAYLDEQQAEASVASYPEQAEKLLQLMVKDPSEFGDQIGFGSDAAATFARVPVLAATDPRRFAELAAKLPPLSYRSILLALSNRYDHGGLRGDLAAERQWAETVEKTRFEIAARSDAVAADRIANNVRWTLSKQLDKVRNEGLTAGTASDISN